MYLLLNVMCVVSNRPSQTKETKVPRMIFTKFPYQMIFTFVWDPGMYPASVGIYPLAQGKKQDICLISILTVELYRS